MDASQFAMWLQGFAELNATPPTPEQWQSIREHLQLVFTKVTPEVKEAAQPVSQEKTLRELIGKEPAVAGWSSGYPKYPYPWPDGTRYVLDQPGKPGVLIC